MKRVSTAVASARIRQRSYFFLSYAHSAPTTGAARSDTDAWVNVFFQDLSAAVEQRARPRPGMEIGFIDHDVPLDSDWKAALVDALGAAEVFVPLYSPGYFSKSWPMRERESFRGRLASSGSEQTQRRVMPVLWIPFPSWDEPPEIGDALELGSGAPEYAENGMRALCMLASYRSAYTMIRDRLADQIVEAAERFPLGPSHALAFDEVPSTVDGDTAFTVAVIAPTRADPPRGRPAHRYAATSKLWRPFGEQQALPLAEYAASTAERLGLPAQVVDFSDAGDLLDEYPAVLLIDPWTLAVEGGEDSLRSTVQNLPEWVVPLVVIDSEDPQYAVRGARLADEVTTMLAEADVPRTTVRQMREFVEVMPVLVTEARRQYLRHAPVFPPEGPPVERPTLSDPHPDPHPDAASTFLNPGKKTDE